MQHQLAHLLVNRNGDKKDYKRNLIRLLHKFKADFKLKPCPIAVRTRRRRFIGRCHIVEAGRFLRFPPRCRYATSLFRRQQFHSPYSLVGR
jgi:hypothetical protein